MIHHPKKIDPYGLLALVCFRIQDWSSNLWTHRINTFCCFFLFSKFNVFFVKVVIWRSSYITITYHVSCRNENFHQRNFRGCSLITLAWLGHVNWRNGTHSFWFAFPTSLVFVCQVIIWLYHVACRSGSVSF